MADKTVILCDVCEAESAGKSTYRICLWSNKRIDVCDTCQARPIAVLMALITRADEQAREEAAERRAASPSFADAQAQATSTYFHKR